MANLSVLCKLLHVAFSPHEKSAGGSPVVVEAPLPSAIVPTHTPGVGNVNLTLTNVSVEVGVDSCSASGGNGAFHLDTSLTLNLTHVAFEYRGSDWPHVHDVGSAQGLMAFNTNVSFDVKSGASQFSFDLLKPLQITLHQRHNDWVTDAIAKLLKMEQSKIAEKVTAAGRKALEKQAAVARDHGACALLAPLKSLPINDAAVALRTPPEPVKVPVMGTVNVSVNSTQFYPVRTLGCEHLGFDGRTLDTKLDEAVAFDFNWTALHKKHRNNGTGTAHVNASVSLRVDLVTGASKVQLGLPQLDLHLTAQEHDWLYKALVAVTTPAAKATLEEFGSRAATKALTRCLADPACPRTRPRRPLLAAAQPEVLLV